MPSYDRPGHENDRGGDTITSADNDELRRITGINSGEEKAMEDSAYSGAAEDMAERAQLDDKTGDTDKKSGDKDKSGNDQSEIPFNDESSSKGKRRNLRGRFLNRKTAIGGGIVGLLVGGGFGILTFISGPAQILQFASLIERIHFSRNSNSSESRVGRFFEYFRASAHGDQSLRNVSYKIEKLSERYRNGLLRDGITMDFEPTGNRSQSRRLQALKIDTTNDRGREALEQLRREGYSVSEDNRVDLRQRPDGSHINARERRRALKAAVDIQGKGKVSSAISKRLLIHRAGVDFHPLRNLRWDTRERLADWRRARKEKRAERIRNPDSAASQYALDGEVDDGTDGASRTEDNDRTVREIKPDVDEAKSAKTLTQRLNVAARFAAGTAAAIGALCTVRSIGNDIEEFKHTHINLVLIRQAMDIVTVKSQIQSGQGFNMDEVGVIVDDFYDEETQTSVMSAPAVKAATGGTFGTLNDVTVKPSDTGEKPELFNIIDKIPVLGTACRAQDGFINGLRRIPVVSEAIKGAEAAATWGINTALSAFGLSMEELMQRVVAVLAGDMVDPFAKGAQLGGNAMIGGLLAANDAAIAAGGTALDLISVKELDRQLAAEQRESFRQKNFFARMFDVYDTNSFVAKAFLQNPGFASAMNNFSSVIKLPLSLPSLFSNGLSSLFSPKALAGPYDYDYGVDVYGFSSDILENEDYADPYENARIVEEEFGLAELNERYGKCFGSTVDPTTFRLIVDESPPYDEVENEDCTRDRGTEAFNRYRIYLLDTVTANSLACYEGDDTSCAEVGFGATTGPSGQAGSGGPLANPGEDTSNLSCPADPLITDGGIAEKHGPGRVLSHRIRLCIIDGDPGFDVNVSIAQSMANMVRAARQEGVELTPVSSAYRDFDHQARLRVNNGCPDVYYSSASSCVTDTARPGESNHEEGLAIDFAGISKCPSRSGNRCVSPNNSKWNWLEANARQYGLNPLRTEAWHWSVTGR